MAERKKDPLAHLKKPTRIKSPSMARDQKLTERKAKGRTLAKTKSKAK